MKITHYETWQMDIKTNKQKTFPSVKHYLKYRHNPGK